jgi:DNA processing protein
MTCSTPSSIRPADFFWLLLHRLPGISAAMVRRLCDQGDPDPERWLQWPPARLAEAGFSAECVGAIGCWRIEGDDFAAARQARADLAWLAANRAALLTFDHPAYPPLLREIADPPPWLYVRGDPQCLSGPQLAIVGSRKATRQGEADAALFAGALARAGFAVTSGMAAGIDAAAHRAALAADGVTIAVVGTGLDRVYPAAHRELATAIAGRGATVSELPLGSPPRAQHFPSRNRIISGLAVGVLVVEAAPRSGSLVTARLALEQNREVFAIPGSIHNPTSKGCNELIRGGATLVQEVQDILDELQGWSRAPEVAARPAPELAPAEALVLAAIGFEPTAPELIAEAAAQPLPEVLATLSELELMGLIEHRAGTYQRC